MLVSGQNEDKERRGHVCSGLIVGVCVLVALVVVTAPECVAANRPARTTAKCRITAVVRPITEWKSNTPRRIELSWEESGEGSLKGSMSAVLFTNVDTTVRVADFQQRIPANASPEAREPSFRFEFDGDGTNATGTATSGRAATHASSGSPSYLRHVSGDGAVRVRLSVCVNGISSRALPDPSYCARMKLIAQPTNTQGGRPSELTVELVSPEASPAETLSRAAQNNEVVAWGGPAGGGGKTIGHMRSPLQRGFLAGLPEDERAPDRLRQLLHCLLRPSSTTPAHAMTEESKDAVVASAGGVQ